MGPLWRTDRGGGACHGDVPCRVRSARASARMDAVRRNRDLDTDSGASGVTSRSGPQPAMADDAKADFGRQGRGADLASVPVETNLKGHLCEETRLRFVRPNRPIWTPWTRCSVNPIPFC